jgi:hypothetical protein
MTPQARNEIRDAAPLVSRFSLRVSWITAVLLLLSAIAAASEAIVMVMSKPQIYVQTDSGDVFRAYVIRGAARDRLLSSPNGRKAVQQALSSK